MAKKAAKKKPATAAPDAQLEAVNRRRAAVRRQLNAERSLRDLTRQLARAVRSRDVAIDGLYAGLAERAAARTVAPTTGE